jgi:hypothetical protein
MIYEPENGTGMSEWLFGKISLQAPILLVLASVVALVSVFYFMAAAKAGLSEIEDHSMTNENYANVVKKMLPRLVNKGLLLFFLGISTGILNLFAAWPDIIYLASALLIMAGLVRLIPAWYIRQGLVYSGLVKLVYGLKQIPKPVRLLFAAQLFFLLVLLVSSIFSGYKYQQFLMLLSTAITVLTGFVLVFMLKREIK